MDLIPHENVHMMSSGLSHSPPVGHDPDYTSSSGDLSKLESCIPSVSEGCNVSSNTPRTFSCQPSSTLPLTSPQPGMAIPLYKYFISVSCASGDSDLSTLITSADFVLFKMETRVCRFRFCVDQPDVFGERDGPGDNRIRLELG